MVSRHRSRIALSLVLTLIAIAGISPLAAQDDRLMAGYWSCFTAYDAGGTIYVTPTWDATALMQEVRNAFMQHLAETYGYKAQVHCSRGDAGIATLAKVSADQAAMYRNWERDGKKVVATGWIYAPAAATLPLLCSAYAQVPNAGVTTEHYFVNKVLRIPGNSQRLLHQAWVDHMNRLHPGYYYQGSGCFLIPSEPGALQVAVDAQLKLYEHRKPEIVRLDWDWRPPTAAAAASQKAADDQPAYYCEKLRADWKVWYVTAVQPLDTSWTRQSYTQAWHRYAASTFKVEGFLGACETGTMKQQLLSRATRMQQVRGIVGSEIHEVDWQYRSP